MKTFILDPEYITSITVFKDYLKDRPEDERLIAKLKGHVYSSTSTEDHPKFTALREQLGTEGYILIQRGWWNGDVVTNPFIFNGFIFKQGDQFPSGAAMSGHLKFMKRK